MTETLPPWRLDDLFQSPEDPLFHAALSEAKA